MAAPSPHTAPGLTCSFRGLRYTETLNTDSVDGEECCTFCASRNHLLSQHSSCICLCLMVFPGARKLHAVCERPIPSSYTCESLADSPNGPAASHTRCALLPTNSKQQQGTSAAPPACCRGGKPCTRLPPREAKSAESPEMIFRVSPFLTANGNSCCQLVLSLVTVTGDCFMRPARYCLLTTT